MKLVHLNWKRPVPFWMLLIAMLVTASVSAGVVILPSVLSPKPDFAMLLSLHPMYLSAEGSSQTLITIKPIGSFAGVVTVTTLSSSGLTTRTQDPQTGGTKDWVILGKGDNLSMSVVPKIVGNFTVTVTAFSGTIAHSTSFPVVVQNLTMISTPSFLTIARGSIATAEIDVSSVNGLSDTVTLGSTVYIFYPIMNLVAGYSNSSMTPTSVLVSPHGTARIILTITVGQAESTLNNLTILVAAHTVKEPWTFSLALCVNVV